MRQIARRYGPDRDLYITELGWATPDVTERQQAQYLVRAYVLCLAERVKLLTWHDLWQYLPGDEASYAILRHDLSPRPALVAYANLVRQLQRAQYIREVPGLESTQRGFVFRKDDRTITVLWDCGEKPTPVRLPHISGDCRAEDIMGRSRRIHRDHRGDATLELNGDSIFVQNSGQSPNP